MMLMLEARNDGRTYASSTLPEGIGNAVVLPHDVLGAAQRRMPMRAFPRATGCCRRKSSWRPARWNEALGGVCTSLAALVATTGVKYWPSPCRREPMPPIGGHVLAHLAVSRLPLCPLRPSPSVVASPKCRKFVSFGVALGKVVSNEGGAHVQGTPHCCGTWLRG